MQVELIDLKTEKLEDKPHVYALAEPHHQRKPAEIRVVEKKDMQVGTDVSKQEMVAS